MGIRTPLDDLALAEAAHLFGLPRPERSLPEPKGSINTNYHLWCEGERFFLRVNEGKSDADVRWEARVVDFLAEARFPAPRLRHAASGEPFAVLGGKQLFIFEYAAGEELARDAVTAARCRRLGETLGRLHGLAEAFSGERANPYGPPAVAAWLADLKVRARGDAEVRGALPLFEEELARAAGLPGAPAGLVHGDLFVDNALWIGDRIAHVLDWEMSCIAPFAWDLAVGVNAWCFTEAFEEERVAQLLAGYAGAKKLDADTRAALYPFCRFVALRYAVSRIRDFHLSGLGGERLAMKDWRRYEARLEALRALGERGFAQLA